MTALGKLTPHQRSTAQQVLRHLAPPLHPAPGVHPYERFVVARAKATIPSPFGTADWPAAPPLGTGVKVAEVGCEGALNRLRMKGYLAAHVTRRGATYQTFYAATEAGVAWYRGYAQRVAS